MLLSTSIHWRSSGRTTAGWAALLAALVMLGSLAASRETQAHGGVAAAQIAHAGLAGCGSNRGKALYNCVADVLDRMTNQTTWKDDPEAQRALQTATSRLRAAVNKVQALSAITQCQAVIAGTLRRIRASGSQGSGLSAIAGVLVQAARLIQSKG